VLGRIHPTVLMSLDNLADMLCRSGDNDMGIQLYEEILRRLQFIKYTAKEKKSEAVIYYKLSRAQRRQNDFHGEKSSLERALTAMQGITTKTAYERSSAKELEARIVMALQGTMKHKN
jgi:hypothetical protein